MLLDLEALLRVEPRAAGSVISLADSRSPPRVSMLPQVPLLPPNLIPQIRTLMTFTQPVFECACTLSERQGAPSAP